MSVNSTDNKVIYTGDGSTDIFPYTFKIYAESDLIVERVTIATGAVATGILDTHYTVSGEGTETGGNVTTIGDWENTSALYKIVIRRKLPLTQEIEFVDNVGTPAATYKEGFDRLCMICQSLQEQIDRSLLRDPTQTSAITFPGASANKLIGWNTAGTALENKETLDEDVLASAAALLVDAQTAATNAQTAATNSTNSANAAAISASEASAAQANLAAIIDTSTDLGGASASDAKVPSQLAVKTYADTKIAIPASGARGDILYHNGTNYARLAKGTDGQFLKIGANDPVWATVLTRQLFTSSGTFTAPAGVTEIYVTLVGGGGGGNTGEDGNNAGSGGAGAQSIIRLRYPVIAGNNYTITVGGKGAGGVAPQDNGDDGGNSSIADGTLGTIIAYGGKGGASFVAGAAVVFSPNASGATSGKLNGIVGGNGALKASTLIGGGGGGSAFGIGGNGGSSAAGEDASGYGAGGGGAGKGAGGQDYDGGDGAPGFVLIEW